MSSDDTERLRVDSNHRCSYAHLLSGEAPLTTRTRKRKWAGLDSNQRRPKPTDLQSAALAAVRPAHNDPNGTRTRYPRRERPVSSPLDYGTVSEPISLSAPFFQALICALVSVSTTMMSSIGTPKINDKATRLSNVGIAVPCCHL